MKEQYVGSILKKLFSLPKLCGNFFTQKANYLIDFSYMTTELTCCWSFFQMRYANDTLAQ